MFDNNIFNKFNNMHVHRSFSMKLRIICLLLVLTQNIVAYGIPEGYQQIACVLKPLAAVGRKARHVSHTHIPGPRSLNKSAPKNQATSTNWCGYVAANNLSNSAQNSVSAVYGSWIVPTIKAANNSNYCAIWIGIDGYSSSSVEQIGTAHDWVNGKAQHYAWFEMYPGGSYAINGFPLNPGDVISASVEYTGNNIFVMTLTNDTKQVSTTIPTSYTTSPTAQRKSAEWVVEAPYLNGILPLTNFGIAYLWGCMANINGVLSPINNNAWQNTSLEMVTNSGVPKSIPSVLLPDQGSFFTTWQHQ